MAATEDQQNAAKDARPDPSAGPLRGAVLAAELLERACAPGSGDPLRLEVVRGLARDLAEEIKTLASVTLSEIGAVEGALRAADVANLAACVVPELLEARAMEAAASTHLAAGAARALCVLVEAAAGCEDDLAAYSLKDARGAAWRAQLAARQVDESLGGAG